MCLRQRIAVDCYAIVGRDGFIRIFDCEPPFASLFAFPIRYERVLSLRFIPQTSTFVSMERSGDGTGNHAVIYEEWQKFPNLLQNVQIVEKDDSIIFNFVSRRGLPTNGHGYISITAPGNIRIKSFQVQGITGDTTFSMDVRIRHLQISNVNGLIVGQNTIERKSINNIKSSKVVSTSNTSQFVFFCFIFLFIISLLFICSQTSNDSKSLKSPKTPHKNKSDITSVLVFELRNCDFQFIPGAYRLSFPVSWKKRTHQRFRREFFTIELCNEHGLVLEAVQNFWMIDNQSAVAAAVGYKNHPIRGGKINLCSENIRSLRNSKYISQMQIYEIGNYYSSKCVQNHANISSLISVENEDESQSWYPSDMETTTVETNESVSCMDVCLESGRIIIACKSLMSIWDVDLVLRTYQVPAVGYDDHCSSNTESENDNTPVSKYRLGSTLVTNNSTLDKKVIMVAVRTAPINILSLHASFVVKYLHLYRNYLTFASHNETRLIHMQIVGQSSLNKADEQIVIIDKLQNSKTLVVEEKSESETENTIEMQSNNNKSIDIQSMNNSMSNVFVIFDNDGCPSTKHHSASFMLIPSIYEYEQQSHLEQKEDDIIQYSSSLTTMINNTPSDSSSVISNDVEMDMDTDIETESESDSPFNIILDNFPDHAHRIDIPSILHSEQISGKMFIGNISYIDDHHSSAPQLNFYALEKQVIERSHSMFDIEQISMVIHRRLSSNERIRSLQMCSVITDANIVKYVITTDESVFVYDLYVKQLMFSLNFRSIVIQSFMSEVFLFVLTEHDINIYSCADVRDSKDPILLWNHPLLSMKQIRILNNNKFCLEFGNQTEVDRFSVNSDGRRLRLQQFDLRIRLQLPSDPNKRPLTIYEQNSPKNILIFEWSSTSEMVMSLITKSHEAMIQKWFALAQRLLILALELIHIAKAQIKPVIKQELQLQNTMDPIFSCTENNMNSESKLNFGNSAAMEDMVRQSINSIFSTAKNWMTPTVNTNTTRIISPSISPLSSVSSVISQDNKYLSMNASKESLLRSEWQMLKQLSKECHALIADAYMSENVPEIAAQHYISSNRNIMKVCQTYDQRLNKIQKKLQIKSKIDSGDKNVHSIIDGLTLFFRLCLQQTEHTNKHLFGRTDIIDDDLCLSILMHFRDHSCFAFSTIILHPLIIDKKCNSHILQWLNTCIERTNDESKHDILLTNMMNYNEYNSICSSTCIPTAMISIVSTHLLAKVVLLCSDSKIEDAQQVMKLMKEEEFCCLLEKRSQLWLEWEHCRLFRQLCCFVHPWQFAKIVLKYCFACYEKERQMYHKSEEIADNNDQFFSLRRLSFTESMEYFEHQTGGKILMQCYLEGIVKYLVHKIEEYEDVQTQTNRPLPGNQHQIYIKYLSQLEDIAFCLLEMYVGYLQDICYEHTTQMLNISSISNESKISVQQNGHSTENKIEEETEYSFIDHHRNIWREQFPFVCKDLPKWLSDMICSNKEQNPNDIQNEKIFIMTRVCTLLSIIKFGSSVNLRDPNSFRMSHMQKEAEEEKEKYESNMILIANQWKRKMDLLLASAPDIPEQFVDCITIVGYVSCGCVEQSIHFVLARQQMIVVQFSLCYCRSLRDWKILLTSVLFLIRSLTEEIKNIPITNELLIDESPSTNEVQLKLDFLQKSYKRIWCNLGRLSSQSCQKNQWMRISDLMSLVPDDGNLEFFAPILSDFCRSQAGNSLNMEVFERIVQIEKDKDYGLNTAVNEIFS